MARKKFDVPVYRPGQNFSDPEMQNLFNMGTKMIVEEIYCQKCGLPIEHIKDESGGKSRSDFMQERRNGMHDKCMYEAYKNASQYQR